MKKCYVVLCCVVLCCVVLRSVCTVVERARRREMKVAAYLYECDDVGMDVMLRASKKRMIQ